MLCRVTFWKVSQIQWRGELVNWTSVTNERPPSLAGFRRSTPCQNYYVFHDLFKVGGETVIKGCQRKQRGAGLSLCTHRRSKKRAIFRYRPTRLPWDAAHLWGCRPCPTAEPSKASEWGGLGQTCWPLLKAAKPPGSLLIQAIPPITRRRRTSVEKGGAWKSLKK